jgi:hypothetical protein
MDEARRYVRRVILPQSGGHGHHAANAENLNLEPPLSRSRTKRSGARSDFRETPAIRSQGGGEPEFDAKTQGRRKDAKRPGIQNKKNSDSPSRFFASLRLPCVFALILPCLRGILCPNQRVRSVTLKGLALRAVCERARYIGAPDRITGGSRPLPRCRIRIVAVAVAGPPVPQSESLPPDPFAIRSRAYPGSW